MAVTHKDFFRILPRAMGEHSYSIEQNTVRAKVDQGNVTIEIGPEQVRRIALMAIDFCEVTFEYDNLSEQQVTDFRATFELYYRRGGG